MKSLFFTTIFTTICVIGNMAQASNVRGYIRKDGTCMQPHHRTAPNNTPMNNYSTQGNVNPYTGQAGNKDPYAYGGNSSSSKILHNKGW